ncbi:MAG: hypothetical protein AABX51_08960 [Nanoarchaeota archaeon]
MGNLPHGTSNFKQGTITSPSQLVGPLHSPKPRGLSVEDTHISKTWLAKDTKLQVMESWLKYSGLIDSEALYKLIIRWFEEREFEIWEQFYKHKPPEIEIRWEAQKKIDIFRMHRVNVHMHFHDVKEVNIEKEGVKKKLWNTRCRVWIWPEIVTDYPDVFGDRKFTTGFEKKLLYFLNRYLLRRDVELREIDVLYYELWGLHAQIKAFFDMEAKGNAY